VRNVPSVIRVRLVGSAAIMSQDDALERMQATGQQTAGSADWIRAG